MNKKSRLATVSVVIPVHNRAHLIGKALDSVLRQTHPACEIIIVDDCSSDELGLALRAYDAAEVRCIRLPFKRNAAHARNVGAESARGQYVAFLDSDDLWTANHLESKIGLLAANPSARGAYGNYLTTHGRKPVRSSRMRQVTDRESAAEQILSDHSRPRTSTFVFERRPFLHVQFDAALSKHQDWDLIIRFCEIYPVALDEAPTVLVEVGESVRMSGSPNHASTMVFLQKHKNNLTKKTLARMYSKLALTVYMSEGKTPQFYEYYRNIPWSPRCGARPIARKCVLSLPAGDRLIRTIRSALRRIYAAATRIAARGGNPAGAPQPPR